MIEFDGRRSNGEVFPVEASFSGWQGTDGFQYGAILRDISVRKREAETNPISGRTRYADRPCQPQHASRQTRRDDSPRPRADGREVALLVLGLDGFQQINDMLGHANGDLVLRAVSERLSAADRHGAALVARLSGDEFAIAIPLRRHRRNRRAASPSVSRARFDEPLLAGSASAPRQGQHRRGGVSRAAAAPPTNC